MKYRSRAQQGLFNLRASQGKKWAKLAKGVNKATYKGKSGGKKNRKVFARLPTKRKKKK